MTSEVEPLDEPTWLNWTGVALCALAAVCVVALVAAHLGWAPILVALAVGLTALAVALSR